MSVDNGERSSTKLTLKTSYVVIARGYTYTLPKTQLGVACVRDSIGQLSKLGRQITVQVIGNTWRCCQRILQDYNISKHRSSTYKLKEFKDKLLKGSFYEQELLGVDQEEFRIGRVLRKSGDKAYVKWKEYPHTFEGLIPIHDIL